MGLGRIEHQRQPTARRQPFEPVHINRPAVKMHRKHRRRGSTDALFGGLRGDQVGHRVGFHRHRTGTDRRHRQPRCDVGVRRHHDLVAGTDPQPLERQHQRIEPAAHAHGLVRTGHRRPLPLKALEFGAEHEPAAVDHAPGHRQEFGRQRTVLCLQVHETNDRFIHQILQPVGCGRTRLRRRGSTPAP